MKKSLLLVQVKIHRFPRNALDFAVVTARRPNWRLNSYLQIQGFLKTQWLWNSSWIFQISVYPCYMILYNLPSSEIGIISALPFPLVTHGTIVCRPPRQHLVENKFWKLATAITVIGVAGWLWGPMLNYPFAMEVPEVLRTRKKPKPSRWKRGHVWVTSWGPKMLGGSINIFEYHHHEVENTPLYTVYVHNTVLHTYTYSSICVYASKIAFTTRFVTQHKIQDSKKIMKPPGTLHHFSNFHETTSSPCTFDEATPDRPATDSSKFLRWIVGPKRKSSLDPTIQRPR